MVRIGILGAAGYTGGELIRLLLNHPESEIVFANSESNAGNPITDVHEGLIGDTDLVFTDAMPFDEVDVVFFCFGHGKSAQFLKEHTIPANVKIIDLAQDFRIKGDHDYVYGLPEINRPAIEKALHVANPGCFATCIQLGLLPAAQMKLLNEDVAVRCHHSLLMAQQQPEHLQAIPASALTRNQAVADTGARDVGCIHRLYPLSRRLHPWHLCHDGGENRCSP